MARRKSELFNLSFLDLLTGALGAIIFLFIITPKGGESAATVRQAMVYFDTTQMKIYGDLPDSLLHKRSGDTLFTVLLAYKDLPKEEKEPQKIFASRETPVRQETPQKPAPRVETKPTPEPEKPVKVEKPEKKETVTEKPPAKETPVYKGDAPSVPARVSIEISWPDKNDNVDLFVCKGSNCVYGGRKNDDDIGQWDSGKSRNRLFGNDLRTNQEAVRQFDKIVSGQYKIYAMFKDSEQNRKTVTLKGLIYTKDDANVERGENFTHRLTAGDQRVLLGTLILQKNGNYQFIKA
ncbi:MAG: hypothetical protein KDC43_23250 [Saprospiraceae bacterium]|nr:hypothetical protein [Saprospiraceae bacterium]MCB0626753.1 hypothetical protein [Saprospiraceae bacterium]MCB0678092.1 hypothetical protein [Saprospiraceae bacterium]MCB0684373.1 hypothetical protein [Saprospiraceae bacterium]